MVLKDPTTRVMVEAIDNPKRGCLGDVALETAVPGKVHELNLERLIFGPMSLEEVQSRTTYVLRAIHAHEDLVQALTLALEWLENLRDRGCNLLDAQPYKDKAGLEWFRRALTKAKGEAGPSLIR